MNINNTLESIVDTNLSLEYFIYNLMYIKLGFQSHLIGSHYLEDYIELAIKHNYNLYELSPTKSIYPEIAKIHRVDEIKVERTIRKAIEISWKETNNDIKNIVFPVMNNNRPTNSEMIYAIYEYVKAYYPLDNKKFDIEINGTIRKVTQNYIYYQISYMLQRYLENNFKICTRYGITKLHFLSDAIIHAMGYINLSEEDYKGIIQNLSLRYGMYNINSISNDERELNETTDLLLKMCKQIYEVNHDYPFPKNKTYIKTYLNILSNEAHKIIK